jgi:hypothetical protein
MTSTIGIPIKLLNEATVSQHLLLKQLMAIMRLHEEPLDS